MLLAYSLYEGARALMTPARVAADLTRYGLQIPGNPLAYGPTRGRSAPAARCSSG